MDLTGKNQVECLAAFTKTGLHLDNNIPKMKTHHPYTYSLIHYKINLCESNN